MCCSLIIVQTESLQRGTVFMLYSHLMFELTLPFNLAASMNLGITLPLALLNRATTKDIVMTCALYFLHKLSQYVILSMVFLN